MGNPPVWPVEFIVNSSHPADFPLFCFCDPPNSSRMTTIDPKPIIEQKPKNIIHIFHEFPRLLHPFFSCIPMVSPVDPPPRLSLASPMSTPGRLLALRRRSWRRDGPWENSKCRNVPSGKPTKSY